MFQIKTTTGIRFVDNALCDVYRILNILDAGSITVRSRQYKGIPIYLDHDLVPIPQVGYVTEYYIYDDYDYKYMLWPDGSRHNRRLPLSEELLT
jgi:hypothetical protein